MSTLILRDRLVERIVEDLVGPQSPEEVLTDRPSQRYSTGILYPLGSRIRPEENDDGGLAVNVREDAASSPEVSSVSLHATLKPSAAGLSFAVVPDEQDQPPTILAEVSCSTYQRFAVNDDDEEIEGRPRNRAHERWRRIQLNAALELALAAGDTRTDLGSLGIEGLELYVLVTPHVGLLTVTAALSNLRTRGGSSAYDEEQHLFQVELTIAGVSDGSFAPRPSRRAQTDEDSRSAALIYRDVKEYVVGHTCAAHAVIGDDGVVSLSTDWVPRVNVPSVSDLGDKVFDAIRARKEKQPLAAGWLAAASTKDLCEGLAALVSAYREWVSREEERVPQLPAELQPQAREHMKRCGLAAERMEEGITSIRDSQAICRAFQLSQRAMQLQFGWSRGGESLVWRPFQLAFQLLVLPSLARRSHSDRRTMDLLWFPTGGGKTEAYLGLAAFVIFLRRLSSTGTGDGVAVLMRYTLRLLTIQQFQRAAAMILSCELLRRQGQASGLDLPQLGKVPIGIGLWVGAAATPLTLRDALNRSPEDPSTPEQITACPCCGSRLNWRLTPRKSKVQCTSDASECELVATGQTLPIWTIDEEIYRKSPSLVIGTVDKFAQIVRKPETRALFGRHKSDLPPDLIIQDELHLISGPLGSITGLYEVAIDELCRRDDLRPKVIGSTATIRRAEDQIRSLFDRHTFQFPPPGIDASNSGFAVTDTTQSGRLYLGLTTAGRSATYMLQALVATLLQAAMDPRATEEERDPYWTLVGYFNSLRELGRGLVLMQDDVPVSIEQFAERHGERARQIEAPAELTSRVQSHEIRDMLERLNRPLGDPEAVDLLVASNMISVGMDISRLGLMIVNAQPKTLSEYIQATSRVGRGQVPGLVITLYNSMRARDRSHYETFETWHRCLYRDVEATSVTPFASRAQDKALHAVLVALVRHTVAGMERSPVLDDLRRPEAEKIAALIESRVARVDSPERVLVAQKLRALIDEWSKRPDLQTYWDDYNRRISLLMSAEQFAAASGSDADLNPEGARRALWPTPNSMREVEPSAPFKLRNVLKTETN